MARAHFLPLPVCTRVRAHSLVRWWAVALALLLVLQVAAPLIAAAVARQQGVGLVEICSVYGVRVAETATNHDDGEGPPSSKMHTSDQGCALTPLLAASALPSPPPAVVLHAPRLTAQAPRVLGPRLPADATQRWLARTLHAPPVRA